MGELIPNPGGIRSRKLFDGIENLIKDEERDL